MLIRKFQKACRPRERTTSTWIQKQTPFTLTRANQLQLLTRPSVNNKKNLKVMSASRERLLKGALFHLQVLQRGNLQVRNAGNVQVRKGAICKSGRGQAERAAAQAANLLGLSVISKFRGWECLAGARFTCPLPDLQICWSWIDQT